MMQNPIAGVPWLHGYALITGTSSGYGLETARVFEARGWDVIATMRTPREDLFAGLSGSACSRWT